ncbi:MAG: hypothetical protein US31_C0009G0014 [Berkelbacteria bacterium GW2011_GWA1_36_9]|uniref:Uncharacterized protein n=1 Tax=Berkelbacteria bacterium GW2011_GWA1_36_9 TaxID=1618331 RepID=A0A0G0FWB2_9BACT|nr:MAG: hypothetical protein US31_C0009G0014 [Berkelbacteria bacterium GW2011_GWA1_36_9]
MNQLFSGFQTLTFLMEAEKLHPQEFARMSQEAEKLVDQYQLDKKMYDQAYRQIHKRCGSFRQIITNIKDNTSNVSVLPEQILKRTAEYTIKHKFVTDFENEGHRMKACGCFEVQMSPDYQAPKVNYRLLFGRELFRLFYCSGLDYPFQAEKEQPEEFQRLSVESEKLAETYQLSHFKFFWDFCLFYHHCYEFQTTIERARRSINRVDFNFVLRKLTAEFKVRHEFVTTYQSLFDQSIETNRKRQHRACGCTDWLEEKEDIEVFFAHNELFKKYSNDNLIFDIEEEDQPEEFARVRQCSIELYKNYQVDRRQFKNDMEYLTVCCQVFVDHQQEFKRQTNRKYRKYGQMKLVAEFRARHDFVTSYAPVALPSETPIFKRGCGCFSKD